MSTIIFNLIAFLTFLAAVLLLAQAFRDTALLKQYPVLNTVWTRLVLIGIAASMLCKLLYLFPATYYWTAFNACVLVGLAYIYLLYRQLYFELEIITEGGPVKVYISATQYTQISPLVAARRYRWSGTAVVEFERELIDIAQQYDSDRWEAILLDIGRDSDDRVNLDGPPDFGNHKYEGRQDYHLIQGIAEIIPGHPFLTPETPFYVPAGAWHHFRRHNRCVGVTFIEKKRRRLWWPLNLIFN